MADIVRSILVCSPGGTESMSAGGRHEEEGNKEGA